MRKKSAKARPNSWGNRAKLRKRKGKKNFGGIRIRNKRESTEKFLH